MGIVYFIVTCCILLLKLQAFRKLPYAEVQVAVVFYRLQVCDLSNAQCEGFKVVKLGSCVAA